MTYRVSSLEELRPLALGWGFVDGVLDALNLGLGWKVAICAAQIIDHLDSLVMVTLAQEPSG
jgi:hypothetical protein